MRRNELDYILSTMLGLDRQTETVILRRTEVSDLNFTVDRPLQVEQNGELVAVASNPSINRLTPFQTEMVALNLIGGNARLTEDLIRTGSCDSSYSVADQLRFRVNVFSQRGKYSIVMRKLNTEIPSLTQLQLPEIFRQVVQEKTGLVLVTGATGAGKSTTLAAILNEINLTKSVHIITLEDPVEFLHPHKKSTFNQREMGSDFSTFAAGLRAALRQSPKVVLVGEMRDRETVEIGLAAAETGHLVLSTLHTIDAGQTVNRILGMFEPEEQEQIRIRLSDTLRWVISQRLAPKVGGGRYALLETMGANLRTKETIVQGETEGKSFYEIIEANHTFGWRNFDQACLEAYELNLVSEESALAYCTKKGVVTRAIDRLKKIRGEHLTSTDLKMRREPVKTTTPAFPATLKLK
ncbi:MAG TPA: PilT/PilU family type 4a pilus ATPase [Candidatus Saccharimonadales bacterium]|jgi:twitching motility protein PilT|nr:PilT/PilU family type 4a pilus ATPase [Candidatus Saccharimonadales bacterium]